MDHANKNVIETHQKFGDGCFCHKQRMSFKETELWRKTVAPLETEKLLGPQGIRISKETRMKQHIVLKSKMPGHWGKLTKIFCFVCVK